MGMLIILIALSVNISYTSTNNNFTHLCKNVKLFDIFTKRMELNIIYKNIIV